MKLLCEYEKMKSEIDILEEHVRRFYDVEV